MKYLLHFTPDAATPPLADRVASNKAGAAYVAELQKKGTLEVAYSFVTGGGIGIVNVNSHEELWEMLYAYPLFNSFVWRVEPLADVAHTFGRGIQLLEQLSGK
jgi:muconolactone delta-isomerase